MGITRKHGLEWGSKKDLEPGDEEEQPLVGSLPLTPLAKGFSDSL